MKTTVHTAVIAGAGLTGSLLAWRLARQGWRVQVYEAAPQEQPVCAAHTAAAMVAPWAERSVCHDEVFHAGLQSLDLWPQLLADLHQDSGEEIHYGQQGSLIVAHPADQAELTQFGRELRHYGLWNDTSHDDVSLVSGQLLRELEPALNEQLAEGFWLGRETHIDNRALLPALQRAAAKLGAEFTFGKSLQQFPPADLCLDCRGLGARRDIGELRGVRGEVLWIESEVKFSRPVRLLHPRYHLYLVPKGQEAGRYRYILGATEIESEDRSAVSVRSALEMLSALYCLSPALAEARILSFETNLRPALPHHRPEIIPFGNNGLRVNGLFRHGYLLAPAMLLRLQQQHGVALGIRPVQSTATAMGGEQCA